MKKIFTFGVLTFLSKGVLSKEALNKIIKR